MKTVIKLCLTIAFLLCAYSYVDSQTLCTESRCYKLQDELGFYIDSGNPLNVWGVTPGGAALTPCTENRCVKLTDKNGNYIDANNPLPTTTGGGGGGTVTAVTASPPLVSSGGTAPNISANATLTALGAFNSNGCMAQTSVGTFTARTITVGSAKLTISNGNCVSGNPVLDFGSVASTDLSDTTNIMLLNATQSVTGAKSYATNTLKGVDAWLTNGLKDVNGNFVFHTTGVANAVDYLDCQNAATGNPATITCTATGTDSNINIAFVPKGTGSLIAGTGAATGPLQGGSLVLNGSSAGAFTENVPATISPSYSITRASAAATGIPHYSNSSNVITETISAIVGGDMTANTVTSTQMAVVNTRRVCDIVIGDTSGSVITNGQLGPQKRLCFIPAASTVVEIDVSADGGTPNVIVAKISGASASDLLSSALATASSGGIACSKTTSTTGIDGATTCTNTLQNTSLAAGDYIQLTSGTAGGTAKLMTIHVIYTVN